MKVLGIIAEYNPFHLGHLYHLETSKKVTGAEYVVCVMSGNFVQRGEPAIVDKWARAEMALKCGADLVIELPAVFSLSSAEFFALGGIKLLSQMGIVDFLCFGSEAGSLNKIEKVAQVLAHEPTELQKLIKHEMNKGVTFPAARANALKELLDEDIDQIVKEPNNILAIEYLKAIKILKSRLTPVTIKRIEAHYNSEDIRGKIASAKAIRKLVFSTKNPKLIQEFVPAQAYRVILRSWKKGYFPVESEDFSQLIIGQLRKMNTSDLKEYLDVSEGLHNRISKAAYDSGCLEELIQKIKTKRYTQTRIQRILFQLMLGIKQHHIKKASKKENPLYIRVLGFNTKGQKLLKQTKQKATIPIITKTAHLKQLKKPFIKKLLAFDILASDLYALGYKHSDLKKGGRDFYQSPVIVD